jgi:chromosome segregation ATPase
MVEEKPISIRPIINEIVRRLNEDGRRIRDIELRIERIETNLSNIEENLLNQLNDLKIDVTKVGKKIEGFVEKLNSYESEILRLNKELSKTASKADLKKIETYVEILNPVTSKFVTREEMERALEEIRKKKI